MKLKKRKKALAQIQEAVGEQLKILETDLLEIKGTLASHEWLP